MLAERIHVFSSPSNIYLPLGSVAANNENPWAHADSATLLDREAIAVRFYSALMLSELIQERDVAAVAAKYHANRGHLQVWELSTESVY